MGAGRDRLRRNARRGRRTAGRARRRGALGNHLILLVRLDRDYLADLGLGDGIREPIPVQSGAYQQGALEFRLEEMADGYWRFHNHSFAHPPSFDFRASLADEAFLAAKCNALQTMPESTFVQNLVCQIMAHETVTCLTGRVLRHKSGEGNSKALISSCERTRSDTRRGFWHPQCRRVAALAKGRGPTRAAVWRQADRSDHICRHVIAQDCARGSWRLFQRQLPMGAGSARPAISSWRSSKTGRRHQFP